MTAKITKKDQYTELLNLIAEARANGIENYDFNNLEILINKEIEALEKKSESARKRAEKRKSEGDKIRDIILSLLTSEVQTIADLLPKVQEAMNDDTISSNKLTPRLSQLADLGYVIKDKITVADGDGTKSRKVMGYSLSEKTKSEIAD